MRLALELAANPYTSSSSPPSGMYGMGPVVWIGLFEELMPFTGVALDVEHVRASRDALESGDKDSIAGSFYRMWRVVSLPHGVTRNCW